MLKNEVVPPVAADRLIPPELSAVAMKALSREKAGRYAGARELADEINAFMSGGRIGAYQYSTWEIIRGVARRHKAASVMAGVVAVLLVLGSAMLFAAYRQASTERDRTTRLWNVATGSLLQVLEGHADPLRSVAFASDGKSLFTAGRDGLIRRWAVRDMPLAPILTGHTTRRLWRVTYSPDGTLLASAGREGDNTVRLWDAKTARALAVFGPFKEEAAAVGFSPDGKLVADASFDGSARIWRTDTHESWGVLEGHRSASGVTFSPDGKLLATSGLDRKLILWDLATRTPVATLQRHNTHGESSFSPDGNWIVSADLGRKINLWSVPDRKLVAGLSGHPDDTFNAQFSHDGKLIASAGRYGHVLLWNAQTRQLEKELIGHQRWVNTVKFSPDDRMIATGSDEQTVRLWDVASARTLLELRVRTEAFCADFSPDGKTLAVVDLPDIRLYPIDLSVRDADPQALLDDAQREAGMRLDGFALRATGKDER